MITPLSALIADKNRQVHSAAPDVPVIDAVREMNRHNIGALLVLDGDELVGIFSERDVLVRVVAGGLDPETTPVRQVMTTNPVCVTPDMPVEDAMLLVTKRRFRHLPVMHQGALHGLISSGDLTRWLVRDQEHRIDDLSAYIMDVPAH
jgi:CBS domain-containing protein